MTNRITQCSHWLLELRWHLHRVSHSTCLFRSSKCKHKHEAILVQQAVTISNGTLLLCVDIFIRPLMFLFLMLDGWWLWKQISILVTPLRKLLPLDGVLSQNSVSLWLIQYGMIHHVKQNLAMLLVDSKSKGNALNMEDGINTKVFPKM